MLKQTEGSHAVAEAIALCRPQVICAYPITPQTHIVEGLGEMVKAGELVNCEFINVESEFAAMSVAIGASAAGARTYTATSSQGLLFMAEAVYNAAGLGLPIVMTIGNRAIGAPINIWNDHSDSMSMRDAGWIQLYAETNQEALDLHIQAFRLAEELSCPVMVCMDGFILTHAYERVDVPTQEQVDAFLPPYEPRQILDPGRPGEHRRSGRAGGIHRSALPRAPQAVARAGTDSGTRRGIRPAVRTQIGRTPSMLPNRGCGDDRRRARLAERHRAGGRRRDACEGFTHRLGLDLLVPSVSSRRLARGIEARETRCRAREVPRRGLGGIVSDGVRKSLSGIVLNGYTVIAGLGGRAITRGSLTRLFEDAERDELEQVTFLDLNADVISHELERETKSRRTGPTAEAILRRIGTVASGIG